MNYTNIFGGTTIGPADRTYVSLTISEDVTLRWPIEQQISGDDVVADIIDVDATVPGLNVDIPDARQVSSGYTALFNNVGANTVTVRDATGGSIISLAPGEAWFVYLRDNSTEAGSWRTFQLGASVSVANASALAGAGLKAISTTLNQTMPPTSTAVTPIALATADRAQLTIWTGGVGVLDLPDAATVGSDWFTVVRNQGSGNLTLTPAAGTIDGAASLALAPSSSAIVVTDGSNWYTIGLTSSSAASSFSYTTIDVSGSGDFALSGVNLGKTVYNLTGVLTGDRNIVVPNTVAEYWIDNETSGAFSLFVKTAAQVTPIEVLQGDKNILYCDGTDVLSAESATVSFPIAVAQGGTGASTAANAQINLGVPPNTRAMLAGAGIGGGGTLAADRTFTLSLAGLGVFATFTPNVDYVAFLDGTDATNKRAAIDELIGSILSGVRILGSTGDVSIASPGATGWTSVRDSVGQYTITHNLGGFSSYLPFAMCLSNVSTEGINPYIAQAAANSAIVRCHNASDVLADPDNLYFFAYKLFP